MQLEQDSWHEIRQKMLDQFANWIDVAAESESGIATVRTLACDWFQADGELSNTVPSAKINRIGLDSHRDEGLDGSLQGLYGVVNQLTALRHELKLQTKAHRALIERVEDGVQRFEAAAQQIVDNVPAPADEETVDTEKPWIERLIDVDEAVGRLNEAIQQLEQSWNCENVVAEQKPKLTWLGRRATDSLSQQLPDAHWPQRLKQIRNLAEGAKLLVMRLTSHLDDGQIERVGTIGDKVDPRLMQVLEVVSESQFPSGSIVRVFRPGYRIGNRLLRAAQVSASAGS